MDRVGEDSGGGPASWYQAADVSPSGRDHATSGPSSPWVSDTWGSVSTSRTRLPARENLPRQVMDATRLTYSALAVQKGHGSHPCDLLGVLDTLSGLSVISAADNKPGWGISAADRRAGEGSLVPRP